MIQPKTFYDTLKQHDIRFFTGVPDSLLKAFCAYVTDNTPEERNIITANEGAAIALATGHHLATGGIAVVYMQNSGQGNAVNPLTSLADPDVYSIPILLIVGWRGEPGKKDEPQHVKQGKITLKLLDTLDIPYEVLPENEAGAKNAIGKAVRTMRETSAPYALVIRRGTFAPYELQKKIVTNYELNREGAVKLIIDHLGGTDIVVSTTGKTSREVFEYREELGHDHSRDFLTVGCMGHASQIALGISLNTPERQVFCIDGDGAAIMHLGSVAIIGKHGQKNYKHIVINNGAHDSVGGQPTVGFDIDLCAIAKASGYKNAWHAETSEEITTALKQLRDAAGPAMVELLVNKGARKDLGRPTTTPIENKKAFMHFVR